MSIFRANSQFFKSIKAASKYVKSVKYDIKKFSFQISIIEFFNFIEEKNFNRRAKLA